uniref:Uncharacterized protein n=1 Tax=Proboscia inermis TaxID=420281 RepID=A0A7S0CG34_9STRA|mmetsp:Transcript_46280/g.46745  ORF Transcript_46280/g.46745 Transcript_46280/m.46745 type:complete len:127 (+) Transcript_46280:52-432(+)
MTEQQQPPPVNVDDDWEDDTPQEEETQYETQPPEILNGDIEHIDAEQQIPQAGSKAGRDQLLMRFCPHDSSMLYPKVFPRCVNIVLCERSLQKKIAHIFRCLTVFDNCHIFSICGDKNLYRRIDAQ